MGQCFSVIGVKRFIYKKPTGRPSKLTKKQRNQLDQLICQGPQKSGFPGACWRSPMIQWLIYEKFGVEYSVFYIPQLLKNMDFSYQKAKFGADHKEPEKRTQWLEQKWPEILKLAEKKNAYILFDDEASFPQWGSLSYTWAKRGQQPVVKTPEIKEKEIHFHFFPTFDSLKSKVQEALLHFKNLKNEVLSLSGFYNKLAEA
jgi:transposase